MRLLDGVSSALRLSVDNGRLRSEIERTLEQVRQSRSRIVEGAEKARRQLERDLHDGAQQHLVSLGMRLRLAANQARDRGVEPLGVELDGTITMLNTALKELRELAHGIHPSLLTVGRARARRARTRRALPGARGRRRAGRGAAARGRRVDGLLRRRRGAREHRQALEGDAGMGARARRRARRARPRRARQRGRRRLTGRAAAWSASPTASTPSTARSPSRARPARAPPSPCGSRSRTHGCGRSALRVASGRAARSTR